MIRSVTDPVLLVTASWSNLYSTFSITYIYIYKLFNLKFSSLWINKMNSQYRSQEIWLWNENRNDKTFRSRYTCIWRFDKIWRERSFLWSDLIPVVEKKNFELFTAGKVFIGVYNMHKKKKSLICGNHVWTKLTDKGNRVVIYNAMNFISSIYSINEIRRTDTYQMASID